jgi:hypothetical protein
MDGWVGGWMEGKAGLRIAYSNQKSENLITTNFSLKSEIYSNKFFGATSWQNFC